MLNTDVFKTEKLTEHITRVWMPGSVFSYLVTGSERAAVIDTGFGAGPFRRFVEEQLDGMPYDLLLTHGHFDHAGGASEFEKVWMHPADLAVAAEHTRKELRKRSLLRALPQLEDGDLAEPKAGGYEPLGYGQVFDLGGETLEIVCLGGHTPGSVGVLFREERILLAGDACCSATLLFGGDGSLSIREYRENLIRTWEKYGADFDEVLYSHPHNYGGPEVIPQMIGLLEEILAGKDDRIPRESPFGGVSYTAKATGRDGRRADGKIANLSYTGDKL